MCPYAERRDCQLQDSFCSCLDFGIFHPIRCCDGPPSHRRMSLLTEKPISIINEPNTVPLSGRTLVLVAPCFVMIMPVGMLHPGDVPFFGAELPERTQTGYANPGHGMPATITILSSKKNRTARARTTTGRPNATLGQRITLIAFNRSDGRQSPVGLQARPTNQPTNTGTAELADRNH